jgi:hypothetical protein
MKRNPTRSPISPRVLSAEELRASTGGGMFGLPSGAELQAMLDRLAALVAAQRATAQEIVRNLSV